MKYKKAVIVEEEAKDTGAVRIDASRLVNVGTADFGVIEARAAGNLAGKALFLPGDYDYVVAKDSANSLVLIPLKKSE